MRTFNHLPLFYHRDTVGIFPCSVCVSLLLVLAMDAALRAFPGGVVFHVLAPCSLRFGRSLVDLVLRDQLDFEADSTLM